MHLFEHHPLTLYDLNKKRKPLVMTNLTRSWKVNELIVDRVTTYHPYTIREGDRPDIIAEKMYGDGRLDWAILMTNNILKPLWEWPLMHNEFNAFIKNKYGSPSNAMATVHHYEMIAQVATKEARDGEIFITPEVVYEVDETTWLATPINMRRSVDELTYEDRLNEEKRNIRILDPNFIPELKQLAENVFD